MIHFMNNETSVIWRADRASAVRLVQTLHDLEWGWTRADIERLVDEHPDWKVHREFADLLVVGLERSGGFGSPQVPELFLDTFVPKGPHYQRARLPLLEFRLPIPPDERGEALRELSQALEGVGTPTAAPASADGFGLRWQSEARTMLLQSNDRRAWISVQPLMRQAGHLSPDTLHLIADRLPTLHDQVGDAVANDLLQLYRFEQEPTMEHRREVFGEVFRGVCGVIGEPTLYGGGPSGPDVRWRNSGADARVLRLRADTRHVWVETGPAAKLEDEEGSTFASGGPSGGPDGQSDFPLLPYTWQLLLVGPGDTATYLPGGRLALTLPHLKESLEILLRVWIEQLPVQRPGEKATFRIASRHISGGLSFAYQTDKGILLRVGGREGDPVAVAEAMRADGWQASGSRWKAEFKQPTERTAAEVAALVNAELVARGITDPYLELTAKGIGIGTPSHGAHGFVRVTGLGIKSA
jgi:hypothetical protein